MQLYRSQRKAAALLPSSPVSSSSPDGARQPARQRTSPASPSSIPRETSFLRLGQSCWPFQRRAGNKDRRVCTVYLNVTERRAAARKPYPARLQVCNSACKRLLWRGPLKPITFLSHQYILVESILYFGGSLDTYCLKTLPRLMHIAQHGIGWVEG